jgi:hypothetical protein
MITIHKYQLETVGEQTIDLPSGAVILHVGLDCDKTLCFWAMVDNKETVMVRTPFYIIGTGHPWPTVDEGVHHIGSVVIGRLVLHVLKP